MDTDRRWRIGGTLFVRAGKSFAAIQKAPVPGEHYEFADQWALPGGMARRRDDGSGEPSALQILEDSLLRRSSMEAGLMADDLRAWRVSSRLGPIVTSYSAKGRQRHTLLVTYECDVPIGTRLIGGDHSVLEASWFDMRPPWPKLTPGSLLAIAHLTWPTLDPGTREVVMPSVTAAVTACSAWAKDVGIGPVPTPDADVDTLDHWKRSFVGLATG